MDDKHKGSYAELRAAAWLLDQGYDVFRNVSQHGKIDIVAIKDGVIRCFDVKKSYRGGSPVSGVEYLSMNDDGSFRAMGARVKRSATIIREATPRELVLRRLNIVGGG